MNLTPLKDKKATDKKIKIESGNGLGFGGVCIGTWDRRQGDL